MMEHHVVLRIVAKLLMPLIMIFALYVQFHGDYGPGGGFQAGVIFASALILHSLIFGVERTLRVVSFNVLRVFSALGLLLYIGVGIATLLLDANFLDYNALASVPTHGQHLGIFLVELGVGVTVAAVMTMIFFTVVRPQ